MFVVTDENNNILIGPINWSPAMISHVIESRTGEEVTIFPSDYQRVPFSPVEGIKIRNAIVVDPGHDEMFSDLRGPSWSFTEDTGTATYAAVDKDIRFAKTHLKDFIASLRWTKEHSFFDVTIKDDKFTLSTDRDKRSVYFQKFMVMDDDEVASFKIDNKWYNFTKADLKTIIKAIDGKVQECFDWESSIGEEIDNSTTKEQLISIREREMKLMKPSLDI